MVWADMKAFVESRFRNIIEVKEAIFEYNMTLTPEKCSKFIKHLRLVMPVVRAKDGGWSNMRNHKKLFFLKS